LYFYVKKAAVMTEHQWKTLLDVVNGKEVSPLPVGFIIDSPWLPKWYGIKILDYFSNDELWLKANLSAINTFPDVIFLPGFWSEYGMCGEPSAFGAISSFPADEFPHAKKTIHCIDDISRVTKPNPRTDGLAPLMTNRLLLNQKKIEEAGHHIYFSVSRGPLNIASYLMGVTEFLTAMMMDPEKVHHLLSIITEYLAEWHDHQKQVFPTIDGILMLDDIIGFIGEAEFMEFGLPYFKKLYDRDLSIKFLHNDADCHASLQYLPEMGVNLFNMGFDIPLNELKAATGDKVTMLGNLPPRDVLAKGTEADVRNGVKKILSELEDKKRVIMSCGGGMPPEVSSANIKAFTETVRKMS
jgi:uroporphyrinogen-III decarboxylase